MFSSISLVRRQSPGADLPCGAVKPLALPAGCRRRFCPVHTSGLRDTSRTILLQCEWLASKSTCGQLPGYRDGVSGRTFAGPTGDNCRNRCDDASRKAGSRKNLRSGRFRAGRCAGLSVSDYFRRHRLGEPRHGIGVTGKWDQGRTPSTGFTGTIRAIRAMTFLFCSAFFRS